MTLTDFLLARIAEDEAAAGAVPPLGHNYNMGGKRQDEQFTFGRTLPSSADGMGNWSEHRNSPTTRAHFARHDPARVLAECEAKRQIVQRERANGIGRPDAFPWNTATLAAVYADHTDYREEWRP